MKIIEPCTLAIFGAAGNLSRLKLIPALFSLEKVGRLPEKLVLLACNVEQRRREEWVAEVCAILEPLYPQGIDQPALERFCARWHHYASAPGEDAPYLKLQQMLEENIDDLKRSFGTHIFRETWGKVAIGAGYLQRATTRILAVALQYRITQALVIAP